ncbi:protein of unknown function (plasmid) [Cupriavidus taiwanensis]|uniref:Uncharacterized protein n=1 Tax=Cupriavidus taiwanensis TaxID=164546 RepID=A0A375IU66_9BURK|nr:protein of unknown function [Cupriavidus taiwanensis]
MAAPNAADDRLAHRTVTNAGALDCCYGVLAGLAVAIAYRDAGVAAAARTIMIGVFTNEEGVRYQADMMGPLVYAMNIRCELHPKSWTPTFGVFSCIGTPSSLGCRSSRNIWAGR